MEPVSRRLYDLAGLYIVVATALMVLGAHPRSLAANEGLGSAWVLERLAGTELGDSRFARRHLSTDLLAGTWFFTLFMLACCAFGLIDFALEPSTLSLVFLVSQLPFAAGAALLAKASYPDNLNQPHALWGDAEDRGLRITDELLLRGLVDAASLI